MAGLSRWCGLDKKRRHTLAIYQRCSAYQRPLFAYQQSNSAGLTPNICRLWSGLPGIRNPPRGETAMGERLRCRGYGNLTGVPAGVTRRTIWPKIFALLIVFCRSAPKVLTTYMGALLEPKGGKRES